MPVQKPLVVDNGTTQTLPSGDQLDLGGYALPAADGASGDVITTDGAGNATWAAPTGGPPSGAAGPTYLSGTYPDPAVVGLGQKVLWLVEGGKYASLQAAYNAASEGDTIMVGPKATGTWGDLTLAENKTMSFVGMNGVEGKSAKIGSVTFSPTTGGLNINRNEYYFANLMMTGSFASQAVLFSGTGAGRMRFAGCYVDNTSTTGDGVVNSNTYAASGTSSSLYLDDCVIQVVTTTGVGLRHSGQYTWLKNRTRIEGGLHAIEQTAGLVESIGATISTDGARSTVELSGTATMTVGYSTISNNSDDAAAIGVNVNSASATFGAGDATISVGSSALAAGKAVAGTGTFAFTGISFSYASTIAGTLTQSQALSTSPWFSTRVRQGISLTSPGNSLFEINASGRLSRYNDAAPTNGQLLIGDTAAGYFKAASLTAGTNIAVTPGAGSISVGLSGTVGVANGGTGITTTPVNGALPIGNGTGYTSATLTAGTNIAVTNGAGSISVGLSGAVAVGNGGTGLATAPANGRLLIGNGTGYTLANLTAGTNIGITNGAGSITVALSGVVLPANGGTGSALIPSNGQIPIGNGTSANWANLTAGTGIAVTNGAGSITIAASNAAGVQPIASTSANITLTTANYTVICNSTTQNITATLPLATGNTGRVFIIKRNGAAFTVTVGSSSNIDGSPTYSLAADKAAVTVQSDGTTWWVIAKA